MCCVPRVTWFELLSSVAASPCGVVQGVCKEEIEMTKLKVHYVAPATGLVACGIHRRSIGKRYTSIPGKVTCVRCKAVLRAGRKK